MRLEWYDVFQALGDCRNAIRERFLKRIIDDNNSR